ncbi:hypothetical protein LP41P_02595 [Lactiplantibacillus plantarum]|jgi:hypothetical protein|uniref:hypothetical protein n=1 Tax=Lactiplantibacillus plantarum TaxID=1590 RepID=UPI0006A5CAD6|nr:hypothetical protein [Lactiplantibacillus plantarum]ASD33404.1 hypothetical protein CEF05_12535 [Lactiplantibacillus plantarum]AXI11732.1 hypothetical protein C6I22_02630 [Lactiplantibacillus plantarum]KOE72563.1 hypothetical protein AB662_07200 [Lactiplantibacillus plantarum]MBW4798680.1 hypothetical protein [Lactiplantibacillus plantarum]MBW4806679.1 hypothetical protein [Lactiplantibacillus plantarum]
MELLNTSISYSIDGTGNTSSVIAGIRGEVEGRLTITANITIYPADLAEGTTFDDLSKKQLFALAIKKLPALLPNLAYTNYQFFVQNDAPVRLTAYSNLSNNGSYITLNSTLDQSDFADNPIGSVGYEDVKSAVQTILNQEFQASSTEA